MPRRPWLLTEQVQGPIWLVPSFERAIVSSHNTAGHAAGTRGALFCLQAHAHTIPSAGCTSPSASSGKVNVCTEAISWICLLSLRGIEAAITTGPLRPHSPGLLQSARASPGCPVPYGVALWSRSLCAPSTFPGPLARGCPAPGCFSSEGFTAHCPALSSSQA